MVFIDNVVVSKWGRARKNKKALARGKSTGGRGSTLSDVAEAGDQTD